MMIIDAIPYIRFYGKILLIFCVFILNTTLGYSATVRVNWDANTEADLEGYKVYYGTSSETQGWSVCDAGMVTQYDVAGLSQGEIWFFAVTAYDTSGNESGFSVQASVYIPTQAVEPGVDSDHDFIPDSIEEQWGLDPENPMDALADNDKDGVENLAEYLAGTNPLDSGDCPSSQEAGIVRDLIAEVGHDVDIYSEISDAYSVVALTDPDTSPLISGGILQGEDYTGEFEYNVFDENADLFCRLRVSIMDEILAQGPYDPDLGIVIEDSSGRVGMEIMAGAIMREAPVAVGSLRDISTEGVVNDEGDIILCEFDLAPLGLSLSNKAEIFIECDASNPLVRRWDIPTETWVNLDAGNISCNEGRVEFTTQTLGHFMIAEQGAVSETPDTKASVSAGAGSGSGSGGCFISMAGL
ncbi:MAG: fibronectin type III domain-containing protein [Thermodesulfobacteriota bacterium]|nr:fibronectin type III domain-containing protein [Thermodesulfobacteriota bacterium]